jgi:hypothetical protein
VLHEFSLLTPHSSVEPYFPSKAPESEIKWHNHYIWCRENVTIKADVILVLLHTLHNHQQGYFVMERCSRIIFFPSIGITNTTLSDQILGHSLCSRAFSKEK